MNIFLWQKIHKKPNHYQNIQFHAASYVCCEQLHYVRKLAIFAIKITLFLAKYHKLITVYLNKQNKKVKTSNLPSIDQLHYSLAASHWDLKKCIYIYIFTMAFVGLGNLSYDSTRCQLRSPKHYLMWVVRWLIYFGNQVI